jgi:hypothetical protein
MFFGMGGRFGTIDRAWLRVHPAHGDPAREHRLVADRDPPMGEDEARLFDAIERALSG